MIANALLSFGIVLTTASQLRLPGIPLGVGEVCLVLWLAFVSLRVIVTGQIYNATALLRIGAFWACLALALSIGTCVAYLSEELDLPTMLHDTFAYLLVAALTCLIVATMEANAALRQTQWFLLAFWNIALVLQIAAGWSIISLPSVDPWYWDRFRGWAENPNQIALYCAVLTPLSPHSGIIQLPANLRRRAPDQKRYISCCDGDCHRDLFFAAFAQLADLATAQTKFPVGGRGSGHRRRRPSGARISTVCRCDRR
jgi:hypothetical protein